MSLAQTAIAGDVGVADTNNGYLATHDPTAVKTGMT